MNKANILKLAEYMETLPDEEYNQLYFSHQGGIECGTPSCIAGHAAWLAGCFGEWEAMTGAAEWLALPYGLERGLFAPNPAGEGGWSPTPQDAAWTLRHLAETGSVVWRPQPEDPD